MRDVPYLSVLPDPLPSCVGWFDVALWIGRVDTLFPSHVGYVQGANAFQAVEGAMSAACVWKAACASARALDGSIVYRAFGVSVPPLPADEEIPVWEQREQSVLETVEG
jgi:hypothetical protein